MIKLNVLFGFQLSREFDHDGLIAIGIPVLVEFAIFHACRSESSHWWGEVEDVFQVGHCGSRLF